MSNTITLKAKGLYTFPNPIGGVPEGALTLAENINIDRDGVIEPRRGINTFCMFGTVSDRAKQLITYKNSLLVHYDSKLAINVDTSYPDLSSWEYTGFSLSAPSGTTKIKYIESQGNLYFTSSKGIYRIDASNSSEADPSYGNPQLAGVPQAQYVQAICDYLTPGFLPKISAVSYRVVWGFTDKNAVQHLGVPSSPTVVYNYSTKISDICAVTLQFQVPSDISSSPRATEFFYQVYRSNIVSSTDVSSIPSPGDELKLVYEAPYVSGTSVTVSDITPEINQLLGQNLYTNEISQEGIL